MQVLQSKILDWIIRRLRLDALLKDIGQAKSEEEITRVVMENRENYVLVQPPATLHKTGRLSEETIQEGRLFLIQNNKKRIQRVIFYLPGGAYLLGPNQFHWSVLNQLIKQTGANGALWEYPKAPEYQARQTLDATAAAYHRLSDQYGPKQITLLGDSAGGGLALGLINLLHERGEDLPGSMVLFSPWLDVGMRHPDIADFEDQDLILNKQGLITCGLMYAGELDTDHPYVSPRFGLLEGIPPVKIFAGGKEMLWPDIRDFTEDVLNAGGDLELFCHPLMQHDYPLFTMVPVSRQALQNSAAFIETRTGCLEGSSH